MKIWIRNNSDNNFGNPINVLKHGNAKQIDTDVFIPLYKQLSKARLGNDMIRERINNINISDEIKNLGRMSNQIGKIWEEFIQNEIRKFMITNTHLKYFIDHQVRKKIVHIPTGSVLIKEEDKLVAEFDYLLLYRNQHPIIIEIKSSTKKCSGYKMNGTSYSSRMKLAKEIFPDYDEPYFLKIRASQNNHDIGLVSRFRDHRKIAMSHSPMLTDLKHRLRKAMFNIQEVKTNG